jgi:hypothetical protein
VRFQAPEIQGFCLDVSPHPETISQCPRRNAPPCPWSGGSYRPNLSLGLPPPPRKLSEIGRLWPGPSLSLSLSSTRLRYISIQAAKALGTSRPDPILRLNGQLFRIIWDLAIGVLSPTQLASHLLSSLQSPDSKLACQFDNWYASRGTTPTLVFERHSPSMTFSDTTPGSTSFTLEVLCQT